MAKEGKKQKEIRENWDRGNWIPEGSMHPIQDLQNSAEYARQHLKKAEKDKKS